MADQWDEKAEALYDEWRAGTQIGDRFKRLIAAELRKQCETFPCGHRKLDWDDSYGECVFCKIKQQADDYDRLPHSVIQCHDKIEELEVELRKLGEEIAKWSAWSGGQIPDDSPGDVIAAHEDGTIVLDDSITTWNPLRALKFLKAERDAAAAELRKMGEEIEWFRAATSETVMWIDAVAEKQAEIVKLKAQTK